MPTFFVERVLIRQLTTQGFPHGASGKEPACQCRRHKRCGFNPRVRKIPWRRTWQSTPIFLPGESHRQRSLTGYSPSGCKESDTANNYHYTILQQLKYVWSRLRTTIWVQDKSSVMSWQFVKRDQVPLVRVRAHTWTHIPSYHLHWYDSPVLSHVHPSQQPQATF